MSRETPDAELPRWVWGVILGSVTGIFVLLLLLFVVSVGLVLLKHEGVDLLKMWQESTHQAREEKPTVHILIPEHPPAGTCMAWLADGALEFVRTCGCSESPSPL